MAGNRVGKSQTGAFEVACHATGRYPNGIEMKRFTHPTTGWICGASGQTIRDIIQYKLIGIVGDDTDTGLIARDLIISTTPSHGVGGLFDTLRSPAHLRRYLDDQHESLRTGCLEMDGHRTRLDFLR